MENDSLLLLKELVKCQSITPDDALCQDIIAKRLTLLGFKCEWMNWGETKNLWARLGTENPVLCFAGHTDVVPPGDISLWDFPPFEPTLKDNILYGRGVADMKGGLAAFITAIERYIKSQKPFKGSIAVLITSDEEGSGQDGSRRVVDLLQKRQEFIDYCIVAEPTSSQYFGDIIKNGRRGSLSGELTIYGKQGHIAYPHLADNPIHKIFYPLNELVDYQWDEGNKYFPATSFQISNIHAGEGATNVTPGKVQISFNFRFSTENTDVSLRKKVESILDSHHLSYDIDWTLSGQPFLTEEGTLTRTLKKVIQDLLNINAKLDTGGGTSDGRFIKNISRELVEFGPLNASIHQVNEHVHIDEIIFSSQIYEKMIDKLLSLR